MLLVNIESGSPSEAAKLFQIVERPSYSGSYNFEVDATFHGGSYYAIGSGIYQRAGQTDLLGAPAQVWMFNARGPKKLATLDHGTNLRFVALSADGSRAATAGEDGSVRIWNSFRGDEISSFRDPSGPLRAIRLSPDGSVAMTRTTDSGVRLWDTLTGRLYATLVGPPKSAAQAEFSPDGGNVVVLHEDGVARVYPVKPEQFIQMGCDIAKDVLDPATLSPAYASICRR
jgi:WD40 repeat protein